MFKKITLEEIRNRFIDIENNHDVYSLSCNGVYFWKLIRFDLFNYIVKSNGVFEVAHPLSAKQKLYKLARLLRYSAANLLNKGKIRECKTLILTHGRKTLFNEKYQDIYLLDYIDKLNKSNEDFFIIDRPDHNGKHLGNNYDNYIYFERFGHLVREIFYPFFIAKINLNKNKLEIDKLKRDLKQNFDIEIDLTKMIKKRIFRFLYEKEYFDKLLDKVKPDKIVIVVAYGKEELIAAAKERKILVTEVQHGIINDYHMGYYFPQDINIPYFPEKLILFGEYWLKSTRYPKNTELKVGKFSFFNSSKNMISQNKKDRILFISQGTVGKVMSEIAVDFATQNNIECLYKLHPSEFNIWMEKYTQLYHSHQSGKIKVIKDEIGINELFQNTKYIVGHNSTALFEALKFNCFVYILDLEGYQYMDYLIKNNYVKIIPSKFTLNDLLDNKIVRINRDMIFNSVERRGQE